MLELVLLLILSTHRFTATFRITSVTPDSFKISGGYHVERTNTSRPTLPQSHVVSGTPIQMDVRKTKLIMKYTNGRLLDSKTRNRVFVLEKVIARNILRFQWCESQNDGYFTWSVKEWTVQQFADILNRKDSMIQFLSVDSKNENQWHNLYKSRYDCVTEYINLIKQM